MLAHSRIVQAGLPADRVLNVVSAERNRSLEALKKGKIQFGKHYIVGVP